MIEVKRLMADPKTGFIAALLSWVNLAFAQFAEVLPVITSLLGAVVMIILIGNHMLARKKLRLEIKRLERDNDIST